MRFGQPRKSKPWRQFGQRQRKAAMSESRNERFAWRFAGIVSNVCYATSSAGDTNIL
jgi:hypothetical protein